MALVATLLQESDRLTRVQFTGTQEPGRAEAKHARILNLCEAGKAAALMRSHSENVRRALRPISLETGAPQETAVVG